MQAKKCLVRMAKEMVFEMQYLALILARSLVWKPLQIPRQKKASKAIPEVDTTGTDSEDSGVETASLSPLLLPLETVMGCFPHSRGSRGPTGNDMQ